MVVSITIRKTQIISRAIKICITYAISMFVNDIFRLFFDHKKVCPICLHRYTGQKSQEEILLEHSKSEQAGLSWAKLSTY